MFCAVGGATDTAEDTSDTAQQVIQQVDYVTDRVDDLGMKLDAIERMLADQQKAEAGLAPPGWVPPDFDMYLLPDSPRSFVPEEKAAPVAPLPTVVPEAATPRPATRPMGPHP